MTKEKEIAEGDAGEGETDTILDETEEEPGMLDQKPSRPKIYTIRTTNGREGIVIDMLSARIKAENLDIKSVFHPAEIRGYVFVEGTLGAIQKALQGLMHVRGLMPRAVELGEIKRFLEYKKERITVEIGDIVEIIGGPFKGEKGKVSRIDSVKNEVTLELLEATIPIPVTIAVEFVKVTRPASKQGSKEKGD